MSFLPPGRCGHRPLRKRNKRCNRRATARVAPTGALQGVQGRAESPSHGFAVPAPFKARGPWGRGMRMFLLRCPKFPRCLTADAGNFDRGHSLTSLFLPPAALSSLPTSARTGLAQISLSSVGADEPVRPPVLCRTHGRAHGPCPTKCSAVGQGACTPPPSLAPHLLQKPCHCETSDRCHWLWQSVLPQKSTAGQV